MVTKAVAKKTVAPKVRVTAKQVAAHREHAKRDLSPKWDNAADVDKATYLRMFHEAMKWYRLESSVKELKPKVIDWMGRNSFDKNQIAAYKKTKDWRSDLTMCSIAASLIKGMPASHIGLNNGADSTEWLKKNIARIIEEGKNDIEVVVADKNTKKIEAVPVMNIQDRIREQAGAMSEEIDAAIDSFIMDPDGFDPKAFKMVSLLRGKGAKAAQARYIKTIFARGHNELVELASGKGDDQLREAYKHLPRKNVKKLIDFYESIYAACDQIAAEAKVMKKPRAAKIKPAEELVKKLKFKMTDDKLGVTSVPPAGLIGAQGAIVYNTKNRKIGLYIAKSSAGLAVKGTTIINFTEKSVQKTLRKPAEQLKELKLENTQRRVETWLGKIKATDIVLNGRMNEDIMVLKVFK